MISDLASLFGLVSVAASLLFTAYQARQLTKQTRINIAISSTSAYIGTAQLVATAHTALLDDPSLRAYFYNGKVCEPGDPNEPRLLTVAELLADACEHGLLMANHLPVDEQWRNYPKELLSHSPITRRIVLKGPHFWPRLANELRRLEVPPQNNGEPETAPG